MSVYKLLPCHYIKLQGPSAKETARSFTDEQFENLKLLLKCSNAKLASLAQTVRDLRRQLQDRDDTIARLSGHQPSHVSKYSLEVTRLHDDRERGAQNLAVDVSSDMQVQLKVQYVDEHSEPAVQVESTVVTKSRLPPSDPSLPMRAPTPSTPVTPTTPAAPATPATPATPGRSAEAPRSGGRPYSPVREGVVLTGAPGPLRKVYSVDVAPDRGSPFYSSLIWRTRQRAKEKGYRFVWSRCGKILVKKDAQSPPMYILDEADLRKMT